MKHTRNEFKDGEHLTAGLYWPKVKDGYQPDCFIYCIECGWNEGGVDPEEMKDLTKQWL